MQIQTDAFSSTLSTKPGSASPHPPQPHIPMRWSDGSSLRAKSNNEREEDENKNEHDLEMKNTNKNEKSEKSETPSTGLQSPQDHQENGNIRHFSPLGSIRSGGSTDANNPHQGNLEASIQQGDLV